MNRTMMTLATMILGFAGTAAAETLEANIPFTFQVGKQSMPSGTYSVSFNTSSLVLAISNQASGQSAFVSLPVLGRQESQPAHLSFSIRPEGTQLTEVCNGPCRQSTKHIRPSSASPSQVATVMLTAPTRSGRS
jgi:hypothetical protein